MAPLVVTELVSEPVTALVSPYEIAEARTIIATIETIILIIISLL